MKKIQVYGTGCKNCQKLYQMVSEAVQELGADIPVEKVEDLNEIVAAGVWRTPALGFDGKVILQGKLPTPATLKNWIQKDMN